MADPTDARLEQEIGGCLHELEQAIFELVRKAGRVADAAECRGDQIDETLARIREVLERTAAS